MAHPRSNDLLLGFYGDDFTGSTDAMEGLTQAGVRTVLFIKSPRPEHLTKYPGLRAIGLAGCSRTMTPERMRGELSEAFETFNRLQLPIVHYKVCSTFDSSAEIGSIGCALETGAECFKTPVVPLLVGAPILGRYCVFGNLFARSGLDTEPYRLDRHPTMSRHPITPMSESDLRLHLGQQTRRRIGLLDVLALEDEQQAEQRYRELAAGGAEVILIDILHRRQEEVIGKLLYDQRGDGSSLFVVGSSGVEYALTAFWRARGQLPEPAPLSAASVRQAMIVSGSCSPVTDRQIEWAIQHGVAEVALNTVRLTDARSAGEEIERAVKTALKLLASGKTVVCHSARGPSDPRREQVVGKLQAAGRDARECSAKILGEALGQILLRTLQQGGVRRSVLVGGDTSYYAAGTLGIEALEMIAPIAPGCPLCRADVPDSPLDGMEICFKGGQVGKDDFFATVLDPARSP